MIKNNLYRLGALMYDNDNPAFSRATTIRKIVESYFILNNNSEVKCVDLPLFVNNAFNIEIHIEEIRAVLHKSKHFEFVSGTCGEKHNKKCSAEIRLTDKRYETIVERENTGSIYYFISNYYNTTTSIQNELSEDDFKILIENFLYSIFVQNMEKSSKMFDMSMNKAELIDELNLTDTQKKIINDFLDFNDDDKNKAIFDIASLALEFVILNGNINLHNQESNILKKVLYLDTNIIFRMMGINGELRKQRVINLIKRCIDTGQEIRITYASQKEFFDSISRHLTKVNDFTYPIRYTEPLDDDIIKNYFDSQSGSVKFYEAKIKADYEFIVKELKIIVEDYDYSTMAKGNERQIIDKYAESIANYKKMRPFEIMPDAVNVAYIQDKRKNSNQSFRDLKEFFLTSDKQLINWELRYQKSYPVSMYPSIWLSIILKFGNRTSDDYKSFVSFIKNVYSEQRKDPDTILATMKVIAEKAETIEKQQALFNIFVENEYENFATLSTFDEKEAYAEDKMPEYIDKIVAELNGKIATLESKVNEDNEKHTDEIGKLKSKESVNRKMILEAFYSEIKQKRKSTLVIFGILLVVSSFFIGKYLLMVISIDTNDLGKIILNFTTNRTIIDDVISLLLLPLWGVSLKKSFASISLQKFREELLLKNVTPSEIDILFSKKGKL